MKEKELRKWMRKEKAEDAWWVSVDGKISSEPMRLSSTFKRAQGRQSSELLVLHDSQKDAKDPPWVVLDLTSELDEAQRRALMSKRRRGLGVVVQLGLLLILGGAGLFFLLKPEPPPPPPPSDPLEQVFEKMETVKAQGGVEAPVGSLLPELKIAVASSGRMLYVSNLSSEAWPSCEVILDGPDGYRYTWNRPLDSQGTLHKPIRDFLRNGESFPNEERVPKTVTVLVPGYRPWEDKFR